MCIKFNKLYIFRWIVECADLFLEINENFRDILPTHDLNPSDHQIQKFFDCVAATMSRQLRQAVFKSLKHYMNKILEYKVKNNYLKKLKCIGMSYNFRMEIK
jgi:dynein heavy chain